MPSVCYEGILEAGENGNFYYLEEDRALHIMIQWPCKCSHLRNLVFLVMQGTST